MNNVLNKKVVKTAGWGTRFQFGYRDKDQNDVGTLDKPTMYSSCMTTIESPMDSRFQYCNTIEVYRIGYKKI